jgi:DNA-binding GntR family transcriptional regulator
MKLYNGKMNKSNPAAIAAAVERDIAEGRLAAGERIDEAALAGRFKVSRTPVREALRQLAATGMVEHRANRGAFVADVTLEDVFDVYEVLAELEGLCAALAARRMTEPERREMLALHERMGKLLAARHRDRYIALDDELHGLLVRAARNAALEGHIAACLRRIAAVRRLSMETVHDLSDAYAEHERLVAAVASRNQAEARRIMAQHVSLRAEQAKDLVAHWKTRKRAA